MANENFVLEFDLADGRTARVHWTNGPPYLGVSYPAGRGRSWAAEVDALRAVVRSCCQCRWDGDPRRQVVECHFHKAQRSVRLPNGDPSDVTLEDRDRRVAAMLRDLLTATHHYKDNPPGVRSSLDMIADRLEFVIKELTDEQAGK